MRKATDKAPDVHSSQLQHFKPHQLARMEEIRDALPGLPLGRVVKLMKAFDQTLSYPSMLTLVPLLREQMPDYMTSKWRKRMNKANADFVLERAKEDKLVDVSLLNTMLQVKASMGSLSETMSFHEDEFRKNGIVSEPAGSIICTYVFLTKSRYRNRTNTVTD